MKLASNVIQAPNCAVHPVTLVLEATRRYRRRIRSFGWGLVALLCVSEAQANVALFKNFIESPPANITNLVYKVRTAGDSTPLALEYDAGQGSFVHSKKLADSRSGLKTGLDEHGFRWFLAKWQPDAFLVRGIDPEKDGSTLTNNPAAFRSGGRYASNYWALFGDTLQTWTAPSPLPADAASPHKRVKTSSAHKGALVASENLRQLLNLGIMSVIPGTIRWDGNRFEIPSADLDSVTIKGTAVVEKDRVVRLELKYNEFPYVIEYDYSRELPLTYLPSRFVVKYLGNQKPEFRSEFEILKIETSPEPLGAVDFDPSNGPRKVALGEGEHYLHTTASRHWIYENGGPKRLGTNGDLIPLKKPVPLATRDTVGHRRLVLTGLAILMLAPVSVLAALWLRNRKIRTQ